jgi:hypothetical protein
MIKRVLRGAIRRTQLWLKEEPVVPKIECGEPPFSYDNANRFFTKIVMEDGLRRPHYVWGALHGVNLAKVLGYKKVSFIEFGVAGGNGLTALELAAEKLEKAFGIDIEIYGLDAGTGMPKPKDNRDVPNMWREGFYPMNQKELERRLKRSKLYIGPVEETVSAFIRSKPAPIAFIVFDLCFYSSTKKAFEVFDADSSVLLPRVHCFFRDVLACTIGDFNGDRLAISEFNEEHKDRKISKIYGLQYFLKPNVGRWVEQSYMAHLFDHPLYANYDGQIEESTLDLQ